MSWWKTLFGTPDVDAPRPDPAIDLSDLTVNEEALYLESAKFVMSTGRCSIAAIQGELKIGYARAAKLMDDLVADYVGSRLEAIPIPRGLGSCECPSRITQAAIVAAMVDSYRPLILPSCKLASIHGRFS